MRRPDNPYFARAIVNRVWAHYFGRGIVDPPDNLSPFNPASHPELLRELAQQFVQNHYDLKWLHRTILASRTYQQSSATSPANAMDRGNYASFSLRRLPAEVLLDALNQATGTTREDGHGILALARQLPHRRDPASAGERVRQVLPGTVRPAGTQLGDPVRL